MKQNWNAQRRLGSGVGALLAIGVAGSPVCAGVVFSLTSFDVPPAYERFTAAALSADGSTVVGRFNQDGGVLTPARWRAAEGFTILPVPAIISNARATAVSADGSVVTAYGTGEQFDRSFRWVDGVGSQIITNPPGRLSFASSAMSYNGQRLVGNALESLGSRAYRWQVGGGFTDLGTVSADPRTEAFAISGNGLTSVGRFRSDMGQFRACRWTDDTGLVPIPPLPSTGAGMALAVSESGGMVVGRMDTFGANSRAFIWTSDQGTVDIGAGVASAVSADGRVVAGHLFPAGSPWVWSHESGRVSIRSILFSEGVDLTGWTLFSVTSISGDGLTVLGQGDFNGQTRSWIAHIPNPGTAAVLLAGLTCLHRRRR